uniref:ATP synthase complex subunit 8 n=1 Tax=Allognosta vagans TaxID=2885619 RepID=A0A8K1KXD4_9DIPT|nr:ATP synthase F0 subunit 8 [Allognosta vagans]
MPQMAPISWLILFIIFSITFIMFNILNYFCFFNNLPMTPQLTKTSTSKTLNWKW